MGRVLGIVGHGKIGSALGQVFSDNGWKVEYFDLSPEKSSVKTPQELAEKSELVIIAAPSYANRSIATSMLPNVRGKLVATVAKGVEPGFVTMHEVLEDVGSGQFVHAILHGPMLAKEISEQKPATIMIATENHEWSAGFDSNSQIHLIYNDDPYSVALCGVLKNIYTLALGMNDGLELGNNSKGLLAVKIIEEFQRLLDELGGNRTLALSIVGIGDLMATGWSEYSFNYKMGKKIANNDSLVDATGEGITALGEIKAKVNLHNYAIIDVLYKIIFDKAQPTLLKELEAY